MCCTASSASAPITPGSPAVELRRTPPRKPWALPPLPAPPWRDGPWRRCCCRSPASPSSSTASSPSSPRSLALGALLFSDLSESTGGVYLGLTGIWCVVTCSGAESYRAPSCGPVGGGEEPALPPDQLRSLYRVGHCFHLNCSL